MVADVISQSGSMALSRWRTMASKSSTVSKSGQCHLEGIEAIEQVRAEAPLGNGLVEGGVGGGDKKDIDLGSGAANGTYGPVV